MMGRQLKLYHYSYHTILLLVLLRLSYSHSNVVDTIPDQTDLDLENPGVDVKKPNVNDRVDLDLESQSQSSDSQAIPPKLPPANPTSPDEVNTRVKSAADGPVVGTSSEDVKADKAGANDVKPTKDDWFYNPEDEEDIDATWDDEESSYEKADLDNSAPVAPSVVPLLDVDKDEDVEDDEDDEDETNYKLWDRLRDHDQNPNDVEDEEGDEGGFDEDFDEKLHDDLVDEDLVKSNKPPTAPSKMVLFYTWMILAVLIMVIGVSTYQARCKSIHLNGFRHTTREDRKRLVDHEYT